MCEAICAGLQLPKRLKHFHFWCIQSDESRRGFSSDSGRVARSPAILRLEETRGFYGTVTTTFPTCAFDSRYLYASTVWANGKVFAIFG